MTPWHIPDAALTQYALAPERIDEVTASSIEQHLLACHECRIAISATADPADLHDSWIGVVDVIDRPRRSIAERVLARLGMPEELARVVGATPGLRLAWLSTVVLLAAVAVAASRSRGTDSIFLALAPAVPLVSVLLTFLPAEEPAGEVTVATPLFGAGLVLRRVVVALVPTFVVLGTASAALPDLSSGAAWLLPGLALALGALALSAYLRPTVAAALLGAGWLTILVGATVLDDRRVALAETSIFGARGQTTALALAVFAAALLYVRRDRFSIMEVPA